ncbi:MAG: IS200/IS605 family transposase [Chloroflexi bacterium]|nr:IS200/IS605 family transposase [Chloroflexota bacterium]
MPYWRLFYHLVWATKGREALITTESLERTLIAGVRDKASEMGAIVHAVGCADDHVHLVVSVPPSVGLAAFVGQVKGASSHLVNHTLPLPQRFGWQAEYGVVSFGEKQLPWVVDYVENQRRHHADRSTYASLERYEPLAEEPGGE